MTQYRKHDLNDVELDEIYMKHLSSMTIEELHSKSDIASELAWRDLQIKRLMNIFIEVFDDYKDACEGWCDGYRDYGEELIERTEKVLSENGLMEYNNLVNQGRIEIASEAYQVIGALAGVLGFFSNIEIEKNLKDELRRALDYFSAVQSGENITNSILPFGNFDIPQNKVKNEENN